MPVISTRYSTTGSYISPSSIGTYRSTADRTLDRPNYTSATESYLNRSRPTYRTSLSSSTTVGLSGFRDTTPTNYRHSTYISGSSNGNDSILGSSRYTGVSSTLSSNSTASSSSTRARPSVEKEFVGGKGSTSCNSQLPPTGHHLAPRHLNRSESRIRGGDSNLNGGGTCSTCAGPASGVSDLCNHHHHYHHTPITRSSSLARAVATCGADLYDKYSPANYTPKAELIRSRSLTDNNTQNKLTKSTSNSTLVINNNNNTSSTTGEGDRETLNNNCARSIGGVTTPGKVKSTNLQASAAIAVAPSNCDNNRLLTTRKPQHLHPNTNTVCSNTNQNNATTRSSSTNCSSSSHHRHHHNTNLKNSTQQDTQKHTASSPVVASKTKSINTLIDSLNQKLQSLEHTVGKNKQANKAAKANVENNNSRNRAAASGYCNHTMPSTTNGSNFTQGTTGSLKATRLQIGSTPSTTEPSSKIIQNGGAIPNGHLKRITARDENFLRNEYEEARNQVIGKSNGNSSNNSNNNNSIRITNKTNNIAKHNNIIVNGNSGTSGSSSNVNVNCRNIINVDDELDKVRSKILSKVNANMMINGENVNGDGGDEDIKFIDSDDDKKLSPPSSSTTTTKTQQQQNNTTSANITIKTTKTTQPSSLSSTTTTSSSSPSSSLKSRTTSSNRNGTNSSGGSNSSSATVTIGGSKMRVITHTHDDSDTDEQAGQDESTNNVSASATIILPKRTALPATTKSVGLTNGDAKENREASPAKSGSELSTIFLEKKNLSNKLNDSNDSIRNASSSSLRSTLPPSSGSTLTSRILDRDSGLGGSTYSRYSSSRNSNIYDSDSSSSSYIITRSPRTSESSGSKDYSSSNSYDRKTERETTEGLCGLWNIGNTCFMNSVLQCLSNTSELTKAIKTLVSVRSTGKDQRIFTEFQDLIKQMWRPGNRSVNPSEFKMAFSSKNRMFSGSAQQDSQEFLRFFIDSVHSALNTATKAEPITIDDTMSDTKKADLMWNWYSKTENSVIKDLFAGQLKSTLKCTVCENTSVNFDPFWDLSLSLPSNTRCKLSDCLDQFVKEEVMDGDEMPTCSKCKTRRKCTKSFTIQRFPKILVIHLKRFSETRWSKLTTLVEFPTGENVLTLGPYASSSCTDTKNASYSLYATSNHMGSTAGGHYVAFCKHPINRRWYEYNDNSVTEASESSLVSSSAYLLFYERA